MAKEQLLQSYFHSLCKPHTLSLFGEEIMPSEEVDYQIPISLVSEENMAHKFIENLKNLIHSSIEYRKWVKWFKEAYGPPICSVSDNTQTIEVHHHPLTLETYVNMALSFIYNNNLTYTTFLVADLVMRWHYDQKVGACFMSKTYHQRFHDQKDIFIPEHCIHWDYKAFMEDQIIQSQIDDTIISRIVRYMPQIIKDNPSIFPEAFTNQDMSSVDPDDLI